MSEANSAISQVPNGARLIPLTRGKFSIVDECDYFELTKYKWYFDGVYASRRSHIEGGTQKNIRMHRAVLTPPSGLHVDHINGDKLDNRRSNLRPATVSQNIANQKIHTNNKSGYRGVFWSSQRQKYQATIKLNYKNIHIGFFVTPEEAAIARRGAAIKYHGEFARV